MIPMFRVWEMGNERATTTECLSDAQSIRSRVPRRSEGRPWTVERIDRSVVESCQAGGESRRDGGSRLEGEAELIGASSQAGDPCLDRPCPMYELLSKLS